MYLDPLLLCLQDISFPSFLPVSCSQEHQTEPKCKCGCICICTLLWSAELGAGREIWLGLNKTLSCHQYPWILMNKLLVLLKGIFRGVSVEKEEFSTMVKIGSAVLSPH